MFCVGGVVFAGMRKCWLKIFLLSILVCAVFGSAGTAQAGSGIYPDSPRQIAPLDYSGGNATIEFSFSSYYYNDGTFVGYPIAYHIEIYQGLTLIGSDDVWSTSVSFSNFTAGENYSWRVYAVYEFYDEYGDYAGMEYTDWSSLATFRNVPTTEPPLPILVFPKYDLKKGRDVYVGGKACTLAWFPSLTIVNDIGYKVDVAKDSNFSTIIDTLTPSMFMTRENKLPADGSQIFWRVKAENEFGWSDYSMPESFINDCNMSSIGTSSSLNHIDTCSDDFTAGGSTDYLLKDISRRGSGRMKKDAAIITGLESENLVNGEQKALGVQISPFQDADNKWGDLQFQNDAINAQVSAAGFYDYLLSNFSLPIYFGLGSNPLNSYDGDGSSMYNLINDAPSCSSNYWYSGTRNAHFCPNNSRYPELVGHEWGHAVTGTASKRGDFSLGKYEEAGAMGEAFSDWIGMAYKQAICKSTFPSAANVKPLADCANLWLFQGWQNFANLNPANYPNYYNGQWYVQPSYPCTDGVNGNDNCGVHANSFVPNIMFYLLSVGGEHPFSKIKVGKQNNGALEGIGIENAMQIAFRANMEYWSIPTNSTFSFADAAGGMYEAVTKRFSNDPRYYPNNLNQLKNAWAAVGVCTPVSLNSEGTKVSCGLPVIKLNADSSKGAVSDPVKTVTINNKQQQYEPVWGQQVTVTANPQSGYEFSNWKEGVDVVPDAGPSYTFTVDRDRTLTANFKAIGTMDFRSVTVGQSPTLQSITIKNIYKPMITLSTTQLEGAPNSPFTIVSDTCSGKQLIFYDPSRPQDFIYSTCDIQIKFTPFSAGQYSDNLNISATDSSTGQSVFTSSYHLTGIGVNTGVSVTSSSTACGTATISGSQLYGGTATATATPNAGYAFAGWLEDSVIVSSAASYSFIVTGTRSLVAQFTSTPPVIAVMPLIGTFDTVQTGSVSPTHSFAITNSGQLPLTVTSLSLSGLHRAEFSVTVNSCSQPLQPSETCSVQVNFAPASAGLKSARLNITSTDPANPAFVIDLSGYGGTPVMLYNGSYTPDYYTTVQTAYNNALNGNEIKLWASDFSENLTFNRPASVTIRGGYNGNFADRPGKTAIQGSLKISSGTVIIDGLQLGGSSYRSTLNIAVNTPASGTVTSFPSGINCTNSCSSSRLNGDQLTLTATPVGDSVFTGWSGGGCSGTGSCTVTITTDTNVTATFSAAKIAVAPASESFGTAYIGTSTSPQTITVTSSGTHDLIIGALSLSGANASDFTMIDTCSGPPLAPVATCTVQVAFAPSSTGARTASLMIPSNDPQTPVFSVSLNGIGKYPTLTVNKTGNGAGTVTSSSGGINCGSSCSATFTLNTPVTLTATPDFGYTFTGWSGACSGADNCTLTMDADHTATATFIETPLASCSANPVMLNGTLYSSIQAAYNAATDNSTIKLLATDIYESFIANRGITVTIDGGYKCSFSTSSGTTVIHGSPDIATGAVTLINTSINL